jgi:hypothetical protein
MSTRDRPPAPRGLFNERHDQVVTAQIHAYTPQIQSFTPQLDTFALQIRPCAPPRRAFDPLIHFIHAAGSTLGRTSNARAGRRALESVMRGDFRYTGNRTNLHIV